LLDTTLKISSFGETESGELLVVGLDGTIHRITGPSATPSYEGMFESANCDTLSGWAWNSDQPTATINVEILANDVPLATAVANLFRQDLFDAGKGNGYHGFSIATPTSIKDGQPRSIAVRFPDGTVLAGSPKSLVCGSVSSVNYALAANGGVASASSVHSAGYPVAAVNNGDRTGAGWGSGGGWNDATRNVYPDWVQIDFNGPKAISEIGVFTLQDNYGSPVQPTEAMIFSLYGITSFEVQYWNGAAWVTVPDGSITGNNKVWRRIQFTPITTSAVRVLVNASLAGYSRIVEIEAWGTP